MMMHEVTRELALARQAELRSLGRPAVRVDRGDRLTLRIPALSPGRFVRVLRGWLLPQPAEPIQQPT